MKLRYKIHLSLTLPLILLATPVSYAKFDLDSFHTTIISGAFYTDQSGLDGVVTPWRLVVDYKQKIHPDIDIAIRMNSQTGIVSGPYIDGFNTKTENFRIETVKYTQSITESIKTRLGLGKIKANILKEGGSITPMPFSNAMARMPMKASDIAWGVQKSADNFDGAYSIGTAISDVSTQTQSDDRTYSLFLEAYKSSPSGSIWSQYSQNNLVQIMKSDHYFSFGSDYRTRNVTTNGTVYVGTVQGFIGFDCGYKRENIAKLGNSTLGIGYGYSKDLQSTLEISLKKKLLKTFTATASWYHQNPDGGKQFNVTGIKLEHQF